MKQKGVRFFKSVFLKATSVQPVFVNPISFQFFLIILFENFHCARLENILKEDVDFGTFFIVILGSDKVN